MTIPDCSVIAKKEVVTKKVGFDFVCTDGRVRNSSKACLQGDHTTSHLTCDQLELGLSEVRSGFPPPLDLSKFVTTAEGM